MFSVLLSYVSRKTKPKLEDFLILNSNRWGGNIGSLQISAVQITPNGEQQILLWERNETQVKDWRQGQINIRDMQYNFAMKIDGFVGSGWEGDVC